MINRRNLLKGTLALIGAGSVIAGEKLKGAVRGIRADKPMKWVRMGYQMKWSGTRAVQYGVAERDYPAGWCSIAIKRMAWGNFMGGDDFFESGCSVLIDLAKPIKKGRALVWHPDGAITGGAHEKTD